MLLLLLLLIWDHKELGSEHIGQIMIQASRVRLGNGSVRYASAIRPSKMEVRSLGFSAYTIGRVTKTIAKPQRIKFLNVTKKKSGSLPPWCLILTKIYHSHVHVSLL